MITKNQLSIIDEATAIANELAIRLKCSPKEAFPLAMKIYEMDEKYNLLDNISVALDGVVNAIHEGNTYLGEIKEGVHMIGVHIEDCEVILQKM